MGLGSRGLGFRGCFLHHVIKAVKVPILKLPLYPNRVPFKAYYKVSIRGLRVL